MKFKFDLRESVNNNAAIYFEKSKKLKNKIDGTKEVIAKYEDELKNLIEKEKEYSQKEEKEKEIKNRKKAWYEKFRWFFTSSGHLCIGGRDAGSNEQIIKKYTDSKDLVFHTDAAGSPFFILKLGEDTPTNEEIEEAATATACFSRAWKKGFGNTEVFYVLPEQVTKEANSGEYLTKGSFVIRGKTNYARHKMELGVTIDNNVVICAPISALKKYEKVQTIIQGEDKPSEIAKKLHKIFDAGLLDDFIRTLPPGSCKIKK